MSLLEPGKKQETWERFASEIGGAYLQEGPGVLTVRAPADHWTITFHTSTTASATGGVSSLTNIRAPYVSNDGFRFTIYRKGKFSEVTRHFGLPQIEIGYPELDLDFVTKGSDGSKIRALLADATIRQLMQSHRPTYFAAASRNTPDRWPTPGLPGTVEELYFFELDTINNAARLKGLYELFAQTLNRLCQIGSASRDVPDVAG